MKHINSLLACVLTGVGIAGCNSFITAPNDTVSALAEKALAVSSEVGGTDGFGGPLMTEYLGHMPGHMGFVTVDDLAEPTGTVTVMLTNDSDQDGTFHLSYIASHMGIDEQTTDVSVGAGEELSVEIPCAEIVGIGPLTVPGGVGCVLADGSTVPNTMTVPGFLGEDYVCGSTYACSLEADVDDLDEDGDTEELIIVSDGLILHMLNGGPTGHMHGGGFGMMGPHFFVNQ